MQNVWFNGVNLWHSKEGDLHLKIFQTSEIWTIVIFLTYFSCRETNTEMGDSGICDEIQKRELTPMYVVWSVQVWEMWLFLKGNHTKKSNCCLLYQVILETCFTYIWCVICPQSHVNEHGAAITTTLSLQKVMWLGDWSDDCNVPKSQYLTINSMSFIGLISQTPGYRIVQRFSVSSC